VGEKESALEKRNKLKETEAAGEEGTLEGTLLNKGKQMRSKLINAKREISIIGEGEGEEAKPYKTNAAAPKTRSIATSRDLGNRRVPFWNSPQIQQTKGR